MKGTLSGRVSPDRERVSRPSEDRTNKQHFNMMLSEKRKFSTGARDRDASFPRRGGGRPARAARPRGACVACCARGVRSVDRDSRHPARRRAPAPRCAAPAAARGGDRPPRPRRDARAPPPRGDASRSPRHTYRITYINHAFGTLLANRARTSHSELVLVVLHCAIRIRRTHFALFALLALEMDNVAVCYLETHHALDVLLTLAMDDVAV